MVKLTAESRNKLPLLPTFLAFIVVPPSK